MGLPELPAPQAGAIHVHVNEETLGPMSRLALKAKVDSGEVGGTDTFWFAGMADWAEIAQFPDLIDVDEPDMPTDVPAPGSDAAEELAKVVEEVKSETPDAPEAEAPKTEAPAAAGGAPGYGADGKADTPEEDDALDEVFGGLVKESWAYHEEHAFAGHIDEVFIGAIITACLDGGWSLIDLTSNGSHHYLRFEEMETHSRAIVRFTHLTPGLATAKILGQRASVVVGYGEKMKSFTAVWKALKAEYKSGLIQGDAPGTISVDGDMDSQYVYCQVPLYLNIDDYVARDYAVDHVRLTRHFDATLNALRKYLRGRFH